MAKLPQPRAATGARHKGMRGDTMRRVYRLDTLLPDLRTDRSAA
jgi:hypothetical protein